MAKLPKTTLTKFISDWNGRKAWAQQAGIHFNDYATVVKYDYNRMLSGSHPMGSTEAFDALANVKTNGAGVLKTPADTTPSLGQFNFNPIHDLGVAANTIHNDVQGIATGLFHVPQGIYHDVIDAAHGHPGGLAHLIPGYTDITDLFSASGRQYLLQHPISDIIDLSGTGKIANLTESTLRSSGAHDLADFVSKYPNHPLSTGIKKTFMHAANNIDTIDNLKEFGTSIGGHLGQLKPQINFILRPIASAAAALRHTPAPESTAQLHDIKFGDKPPSTPPVSKVLSDLRNSLSGDEFQTLQNMLIEGDKLGYQGLDEGVVNSSLTESGPASNPVNSVYAMLHDPSIPDNVKAAYNTLNRYGHNLTDYNVIHAHNLVYAENPITKESSYVPESSPFARYKREKNPTTGTMESKLTGGFLYQWEKIRSKAESSALSIHQSVNGIMTNIDKIRTADAEVPNELRLPGDNGPVTLPMGIRRAADYFRTHAEENFRHPLAGSTGYSHAARFNSFFKSLKRFLANDGALMKLPSHLQSFHDISQGDEILKMTRSIKSSLRKLNLDKTSPVFTWLDKNINNIDSYVKTVQNNQLSIDNLRRVTDDSSTQLKKMSKRMELNWNRYAKQQFVPLVEKDLKLRMTKALNDYLHGNEVIVHARKSGAVVVNADVVSQAVSAIEHLDFQDEILKQIITPAEFYKMRQDSYLAISDMEARGLHPVFFTSHRVTQLKSIERPTLGDVSRTATRSIKHSRSAVLSDTMYDPIVGIVKETVDIYREHFINHIQSEFLPNIIKTDSDLSALALAQFSRRSKRMVDPRPPSTTQLIDLYAKEHHYIRWDPSTIPGLQSTTRAFTSPTREWIRDYDHKIISGTFNSYSKAFDASWDKAMSIYRIGVLYLSPRYAAHIAIAGTVMTELRLQTPLRSTYRHLGDAIRMARGENLPAFVSKGVSEQDMLGHIYSDPIAMHTFLSSFKVGKMVAEARSVQFAGDKVKGGLAAYKSFLEIVSNAQRALALLDKKDHIRPEELTDEVIAMAKRWNTTPEDYIAGMSANKVMADMQSISPFERAYIQRYLFPFWGWTHHILKYVSTYPLDHPFRMSIIQSISNQAIGDDSQLPEYLYRLLFIGAPDSSGKITALDTRQWNPFRDIANYMTIGGWTAALNPVLSGLLSTSFNIDPVTGGPDLYPSLTYNSFYGGMAATPGTNIFKAVAGQFSPQLNTLMSVMEKTSSLRQEALTNPGKLPYLIASSLGLPWVPFQLNLKNIQIRKSNDEYNLANAAVQKALSTNSMDPLKGFSGYLPLSGYEANTAYINELIQSALVSDKALGAPIPESDLLQLPYSSPYAPEYLLAGKTTP